MTILLGPGGTHTHTEENNFIKLERQMGMKGKRAGSEEILFDKRGEKKLKC